MSHARPKHASPQTARGPVRTYALLGIGALLCGFAFSAAARYAETGFCEPDAAVFGDGALYALCFFVAFGLLALLLGHAQTTYDPTSRLERAVHAAFAKPWRSALVALMLLVCWGPWLVQIAPGIYCADTCQQLVMYASGAGNGVFSAHHPVFDTYLFGTFLYGVNALAGSWHTATLAYTLLQSLACALAIARMAACSVRDLEVAAPVVLVGLVFLAIFPLVPWIVMFIVKDSLFAICFVLFATEFAVAMRTRGESLARARRLAWFIVVCLLCCLTKKLGFFIIAPSLALACLWLRRDCLRIAATLACALLVSLVAMPAFEAAAGIVPGGRQEALAIPMQQTARVASLDPDEVTDKDRAVLEKLFGYSYKELGERYDYRTVDKIKGLDELAVRSDAAYDDFLGTWASLGLRFPVVYFDAFAAQNSPWFTFTPIHGWTFFGPESEFDPWDGYGMGKETIMRWDGSEQSAMAAEGSYTNLSNTPGLQVLFSQGLYGTLIPLFTLLCLLACRDKRRRAWLLVAFVPFALSVVLGLWLAPSATGIGIASERYSMPLVLTAPLMISMAALALNRFTTPECERP